MISIGYTLWLTARVSPITTETRLTNSILRKIGVDLRQKVKTTNHKDDLACF